MCTVILIKKKGFSLYMCDTCGVTEPVISLNYYCKYTFGVHQVHPISHQPSLPSLLWISSLDCMAKFVHIQTFETNFMLRSDGNCPYAYV